MRSKPRDITVKVDEATLRSLRAFGEPAEVLGQLALAAASTSGLEPVRVVAPGDSEPPRSVRLPEDEALIAQQREANEQMIRATLHAHEEAGEAVEARHRAEARQRELETLVEFREMFIGILGHDLRNPLTSVMMSATSLLSRGRLDAADAQSAARVLRGGRRMERMVAQLLDLTRARLAGGFPLACAPTNLGVICRTVLDEFAAPVQLTLAGELDGTWDGDRIAEVVSNLAGNAVEHAAPGTVVTVDAYVDGLDLVVDVGNLGAIIPADVLPFIFEPFRRARQREKSASGNLGLGLYIAHQIASAHGGTLRVRSAEGATTFTLRLPRAFDRPAGAPSMPPAVASLSDGDAGSTATQQKGQCERSRRVLVVDDEQETAELMAHLLDRHGHRALAAPDGPAALDAVGLFDPEVVILDLGLPGMDGYELARTLRSGPGGSDRLIIAVTGYQEDSARLRRAGFDLQLTKPPVMANLFEVIAGWNGRP